MRTMYPVCECLLSKTLLWATSSLGVTSGVGRLRQALDVQSTSDVVLYGGPVTPHYRADGFS